jgi:hypothetical protein
MAMRKSGKLGRVLIPHRDIAETTNAKTQETSRFQPSPLCV